MKLNKQVIKTAILFALTVGLTAYAMIRLASDSASMQANIEQVIKTK